LQNEPACCSKCGGTARRGAHPARECRCRVQYGDHVDPQRWGHDREHVTANCAGAGCTFNTTADLLTPDGPIGFPGDTWARQTITLRSSDRNV
jgi:hypothetical protein